MLLLVLLLLLVPLAYDNENGGKEDEEEAGARCIVAALSHRQNIHTRIASHKYMRYLMGLHLRKYIASDVRALGLLPRS